MAIALFRPVISAAMEDAAIQVLRSGQVASGPGVREFESRLGAFVERSHIVSMSDMTAALTLALRLAGVQAGDLVMTLAFSCMSSNAAIALAGATPVWVDIDPVSASMSVCDLERAWRPGVRALTLYHVAGYPGPSEEIAHFCSKRGIVLIEDCNSALGALQSGRPVGGLGAFAVYAFYPNRQLHAGEGGALACPDSHTAARAARLRRFGIDVQRFRTPDGEIDPTVDIPEIGDASAMPHLNAALALPQFDGLQARLDSARRNAVRLAAACAELTGITPVRTRLDDTASPWVCLALASERDALQRALKQQGIQSTRLHHRNDDYSGFGADRRPLPGTDRVMEEVIALPCGWWLSEGDLVRMIDALHDFYGSQRR